MDNSFAITIAFIVLATLVAAFVRRITRDKCLRDFQNNFVNLLQTDNKTIWGNLRVENTGVELIYKTKHQDADGHEEASYILYKCEYPKIQTILRFLDELSDKNKKHRQKQLVKTYHPRLLSRAKRKTANIFKTIRDSVAEVMNLFISRVKKTAGFGETLVSQDKYVTQMKQQLMGSVGTSYEPLLERYIGRRVVLEMVKGDTVVEYSGVLRDYTAEFIEIMDVDYKAVQNGKSEKADMVVPRQYGLIRHLGE
jgi:small nuclear ribonucleoprotein (snRNP)-like protein